MSLDGTSNTFIPYTINGINPITGSINTTNFVKYNGNTSNTDLGTFDLTTIGTLSAQQFAIPDNNSNNESWITYSVSTMGNLSTVGGLITTDLTNGRSMYFTGGVLGAPNFQFATLGNGGKVVATDANGVMSTTIGVGQLNYITGLTSQAGGIGQQNTWSDIQIHSANVSTTGTNKFIQPYNAVSADISTLVNRATLDSAIAGLGAGILTLNNIWSGTNTFNSTLTTAVGQTTSINGALSTNLVDLGFTSASFTTAGITGTYTAPLGTITNPSGTTYQIAQTAAGRSIMAISGFTPSVGITYVFSFNMKCTIGTATISVEQDNILVSPALYPLTTGFNRVVGSFTYNGTPNTVVFKIYTGVASWNAQWDSFTLSTYNIGMNADMNALTVNNRFTQRYNALATDVSTLVNRATMDSAISATNILNLNNTFTGTNAFNNDVSLGVSTVVVNQQSITTSILQTAGISSQALGGTAVISGTYLLTPTPTTFAYASVYSPTQTFLGNSKYNYLFTGFTAGIFGVSLTVYQANVANTGFVAISSTIPVVVGTFSGIFTPNVNASYLGQVYFTFSGINSKTVGWTTFTYQRGMETVNGNLAVNGDTTAGNLTIQSGYNFKKNGGNTGQNYVQLYGEDIANSPYFGFFSANIRRCYIGFANTTDMFMTAENGAQLNFGTAGSSRMKIKDTGDMTHTAGDSSYMKYGPNGSWTSYLVVGATTSKVASVDTAQVITTNGNLHLDAGNTRDMYYGYYANSNGTPNTHQFYGTVFNFPSGLPQNGGSTSQVAVFDGTNLKKSQCMMKEIYFSNGVAWAGGVNIGNAFYKYASYPIVKLSGKYSGYWGGAGMGQIGIRFYSQTGGTYYYFYYNTFTNNGSNHVTVPLNQIYTTSNLPFTGWYDVYFYSTSAYITDTNDQLTLNVQLLPVSGF